MNVISDFFFFGYITGNDNIRFVQFELSIDSSTIEFHYHKLHSRNSCFCFFLAVLENVIVGIYQMSSDEDNLFWIYL